MKNKKGFTLIELIVIIVLLGVIMVFALPNITSTLERNKKDKMILDAQDMVEKYKNYMLNFKIPGLNMNIYSAISDTPEDFAPYMIFASCSYSNSDVYEFIDLTYDEEKKEQIKSNIEVFFSENEANKNAILTKLSVPLGTLDKREEILDSPFGLQYKRKDKDNNDYNYNLTFDDLGAVEVDQIHTTKEVSYVYMCINDNKTINYKVCLTDGNNTLKADVSELNGDDKYTKISTDKDCNIDQKIE